MATKFNGRTIKNKPDPPTTVATPWNQIVVPLRFGNGTFARGVVDTTNLTRILLNQLGFPTDVPVGIPGIEFRVSEFRAWNTQEQIDDLTTARERGINVDVYDFMDGDRFSQSGDNNLRLITSLNDVQGKDHYANVGFVYPAAHQHYTLGLTTDAVILLGIDFAGEVIVYMYIMWRFTPPKQSVDLKIVQPHSKFEGLRCPPTLALPSGGESV